MGSPLPTGLLGQVCSPSLPGCARSISTDLLALHSGSLQWQGCHENLLSPPSRCVTPLGRSLAPLNLKHTLARTDSWTSSKGCDVSSRRLPRSGTSRDGREVTQKEWEVGVSSRDRGEILRYDIGGWLSDSLAFHLASCPCCTHLASHEWSSECLHLGT